MIPPPEKSGRPLFAVRRAFFTTEKGAQKANRRKPSPVATPALDPTQRPA